MPRTKHCTSRASGTDEPMEQARISGWERSKLSAQDHKMMKKLGLFNKEAVHIPGDKSTPHPLINFRVTFVSFLIRGLSVHVHEFLRGLHFIYGIQLHQLTPTLIFIFPSLSHFASVSWASTLTRAFGNACSISGETTQGASPTM
jgi:hypothetical protein